MKGKITTEFTLWCGGEGCDTWEQLGARHKTQAEALGREYGWKNTRAEGWLCPACASKKGGKKK
jgi:hypothetical protein